MVLVGGAIRSCLGQGGADRAEGRGNGSERISELAGGEARGFGGRHL